VIPRAPQCDDDRCDYGPTGHWQHHPRCATETCQWADDAALQAAREDGYGRPFVSRPQGRGWAA
jgi:hypothetical protein